MYVHMYVVFIFLRCNNDFSNKNTTTIYILYSNNDLRLSICLHIYISSYIWEDVEKRFIINMQIKVTELTLAVKMALVADTALNHHSHSR